ncbi:MAG TPA: hydroxysqualene dehydroxylase HpnE [Blastocatellia bacterium]|nr:hydroxysqualene dehydroxylase HpnE [Blastocatellia bacterium]
MSSGVLVIGGGFAGLAAAVRLCELGMSVTLIERRRFLGGRAYSFIDPQTGDTVDNGQHLFMGCYRHTITFLDKIGSLDRLSFQDRTRVDFLDRTNGLVSFDCPPLPSPLNLAVGIMGLKGLTARDKLHALKVGLAIRSNGKSQVAANAAGLTVAEWLDSLGQSRNIKDRFWYPMAIATLNENPEIASASMLGVVLREGFGGDSASARMGISRVGLSDLYTDNARKFIESHGGTVRFANPVQELLIENGRVRSAILKGGEQIEADYIISAVTHRALQDMLPASLREGEFARLNMLNSSPIVSINLWFDRPVIDREFVGLLGTRVQWLFNKDLIIKGSRASNHIAMIISAAHDFIDWSKTELTGLAKQELNELLPETGSASLLHATVVKEPEATLSHTVLSDRIRPGPRTSIPNLILAGDWTATGLPATIESAVLSGHVAAELIG